MNEPFEPKNIPVKNKDNLEMLRQSLESKEIDREMIPILRKFISLPITPRESCYGHPGTDKRPYLSYVEDDAQNKREADFQRLFKDKIPELRDRINQRIGSEAVEIALEEIDHGGGPKDHTLRFNLIDEKMFQENGKKILDLIWEEFSRYIDRLK